MDTQAKIMSDLYFEVDKWSPRFIFVKGWVECKNGEPIFKSGTYDFVEVMGWCDSNLIRESLENNEEDIKLRQNGIRRFIALFEYNSAQVGGYPPPNIEVPEHCEICHISIRRKISDIRA